MLIMIEEKKTTFILEVWTVLPENGMDGNFYQWEDIFRFVTKNNMSLWIRGFLLQLATKR